MNSQVHTRQERRVFVALVFVTMVYLVIRAACMPLLHDEANSFWWYVRTGEFFPFHAHRDPGNHFLSSFFGWLGYGVFGATEWAVRIGSLLAALLYAAACWRITSIIDHGLVRWIARFAMLWCPFFIEYFALFRGYALGTALWLWTLIEFMRWLEHKHVKDAAWMTLALSGAVFANLTFLPGACVLFGAMAIRGTWLMWSQRGVWRSIALGTLVLVCAAALVFAALVAMDFKSEGQLSFGHQDLVTGSIASLCGTIFPFAEGPVTVLVIVSTILATGVAVRMLVRQRTWGHPLIVLCAALWAEIVMRVVMHLALDVDYPPSRSALHWVPMYLAIIALALDAMATERHAWQWVALILVPLPLLGVVAVNTDHVAGSPEQGAPQRWAHMVALRQQELQRPVLVNGPGLTAAGWAFALRKEGVHVNDMEKDFDANGPHDLRIATRSSLPQANVGYSVIDSAPGPGFFLLERNEPLQLHLLLDSLLPSLHGDMEFAGLLNSHQEWKDQEVLVRISGRMTTRSRVSDVQLVASTKDNSGQEIGDKSHLCHERDTWDRSPFDVMRRMPAGMAGRTVFLFNVTRTHLEVTELRVRIYMPEGL